MADVHTHSFVDLAASLTPPGGGLELNVFRNRTDFEAAVDSFAHRDAYEGAAKRALPDQDTWVIPGVCQICDRATLFRGRVRVHRGVRLPFLQMLCGSCRMGKRQRFTGYVLKHIVDRRHRPTTYFLEQVTRLYKWAENTLAADVVGSEYLGPNVSPGSIVGGIRHEDVTNLSFADGSIDVVVALEVFEHVPDIGQALRECHRILSDEGLLLFTVPFHLGKDKTIKRSELRDGELVELLPAVYHDNPVSNEGSLVFYDYGWDVLAFCRDAGFGNAFLLGYWSAVYGYLGGGFQPLFVAER